MPTLSPAPAPASIPPLTTAPAPVPSRPQPTQRGFPSLLNIIRYHTEIKTHPRFEIGMQNEQQRLLVDFMLKYDAVYTQQATNAVQRRDLGQPDLPEITMMLRKLKVFFEISGAALRQWNEGGPPVNFEDIKSRAGRILTSATPASTAAGAAVQNQTGQTQNPNPTLGPAAQDMLDQMNEISKTDAQRRGMLPPAGGAGAGARLPPQSAFPQHIAPSQSPANPLVPQNPPQKWTGALLISAPRPNAQPTIVRLEVNAIHQAMNDP